MSEAQKEDGTKQYKEKGKFIQENTPTGEGEARRSAVSALSPRQGSEMRPGPTRPGAPSGPGKRPRAGAL